jgi:hypothetical protein
MKTNPYGKKSETPLVLVGAGDRTHARDPKTGGPLCGSWSYNLGDVRPSRATQMTCRRCIKLVVANTTPSQIVDRDLAAAAGKRNLHRMVVGGMEGVNVAKLIPRTSVPQPTPTFQQGPPHHPTQTRLRFQPFEEFEEFEPSAEPRRKK